MGCSQQARMRGEIGVMSLIQDSACDHLQIPGTHWKMLLSGSSQEESVMELPIARLLAMTIIVGSPMRYSLLQRRVLGSR